MGLRTAPGHLRLTWMIMKSSGLESWIRAVAVSEIPDPGTSLDPTFLDLNLGCEKKLDLESDPDSDQ